jgi:hypothetical protein
MNGYRSISRAGVVSDQAGQANLSNRGVTPKTGTFSHSLVLADLLPNCAVEIPILLQNQVFSRFWHINPATLAARQSIPTDCRSNRYSPQPISRRFSKLKTAAMDASETGVSKAGFD